MRNMKAVILAAGLGSRLRPITDSLPKCMVSVNNIKIIDKQIDNLLINGIYDIVVVAGYKYEILFKHINEKYPDIEVINNYRYNETNNMYSLFLTKEFVYNDNFLLMNADVYYDSCIIKGIIQEPLISKIACDKSVFMVESMKITIDNEKINHISKKINESEHYAVSIDVYYINSNDSKVLFQEIENTILVNKDENSWTEVALDNIFCKTNFQPYIINGRWFEIDNHEDLRKAELIFMNDKL